MFSDRVILVFTLVLTAAYFYGTTRIPSLQIGDPLGPKAFPYLISVGLLVSAAWLLLEISQARKVAEPLKPNKEAREPQDRRHLVLIAAVVGWTAIYFSAFQPLGFLLATPVFLFVQMSYFNRGKWLANSLTSVLFTLGAYVLFTKVLGVSLAKGVLSF